MPGPDSGLRNNRGDTGHPLKRPGGPGPVQHEQQGHPLALRLVSAETVGDSLAFLTYRLGA